MKVFALYTVKVALTPEQRKEVMSHEVPATLKLYLEGQIEQFWFRENAGPIFLMNVESVEQAKATLSKLPLVTQNLATLELMPVSPLLPLGLLIQGKYARAPPMIAGLYRRRCWRLKNRTRVPPPQAANCSAASRA
jgi:hypothetical protein